MKNLRLFWYFKLVQQGNGYYYHRWCNFLTGRTELIFAGYTKKALRLPKNTFKDIAFN